MTKKTSFLLAAIALTGILAFACNKPEPEPEPEPDPVPEDPTPVDPKPDDPVVVDLVDFKLSVPVTENWVFTDKPAITIHVENPNPVAVTADVKVRIDTDLKKTLVTIEKSVAVPANEAIDIPVTTKENLEPGFYKAACFVNRAMNSGCSIWSTRPDRIHIIRSCISGTIRTC